jgi:hypothetical protein
MKTRNNTRQPEHTCRKGSCLVLYLVFMCVLVVWCYTLSSCVFLLIYMVIHDFRSHSWFRWELLLSGLIPNIMAVSYFLLGEFLFGFTLGLHDISYSTVSHFLLSEFLSGLTLGLHDNSYSETRQELR